MKLALCIYLFVLLLPIQSFADAISVGRGQSTSFDESNTKRYAYIIESKYVIPYFTEKQLTLDWDISTHFWQNLYGPDITAASIVPLVKYTIETHDITFVARFGIGIAYVDQTRWGNRELGDNWMFEDKLEIGVEVTAQHRVAMLFQHFSNAALNSKNDGTNIVSLNYSYHW